MGITQHTTTILIQFINTILCCHVTEFSCCCTTFSTEGEGCDNEITIPDRYSKFEISEIDENKPKAEKNSMKALLSALKDAKLEFNYASVPVNPFASLDAMMSYLYYDKDRYEEAPDSDLTEESSDEDESSRAEKQLPAAQTKDLYDSALTNGASDTSVTNDVSDASHTNATLDASLTNGASDSSLTNGASDASLTKGTSGNSLEDGNESHNVISKTNRNEPNENKHRKTIKKILRNGSIENTSKGSFKEENTCNETNQLANDKDLIKGAPKIETKDEVNISGAKPKVLVQKKNASLEITHISNGNVTSEIDITNGKYEETSPCNGIPASNNSDKPTYPKPKLAGNSSNKKTKTLVKRAAVYEPSDVQCNKCHYFIDKKTLREYRSAVNFTMQRLRNMKECDPSILYRALDTSL